MLDKPFSCQVVERTLTPAEVDRQVASRYPRPHHTDATRSLLKVDLAAETCRVRKELFYHFLERK